MIQQRPPRIGALRLHTDRAPLKNRLFYFFLLFFPVWPPTSFAQVPEEGWWMRPAISADRRRSLSIPPALTAAQVPANPPRSLSRLPHPRSRAALALRSCSWCCLPRMGYKANSTTTTTTTTTTDFRAPTFYRHAPLCPLATF
ncbi:hypothetical protein BDP81DRAFT_68781 [Colletotrichum phormii]|uniref:Uncharacterized protein n=1 Tax=Colletotrichum phormii TaxID=359342 RepID=A0AAI9ZKZ9_9PEZI|nr:uncharacterized protein BDP81DRAFT_68781 [Colletotrichum phormii]KAK1633615.1 hypothetical protein BDP81DRAFT_68781 [Colletotrichum phormii]